MMEALKTHNEKITSLEIAQITGKHHKDVMRAIRKMEEAWQKINGRKFALVEYKDSKGEKRPMFQLSKTESLYIATKFNDEARAKLILRWEELETRNITPDFSNPNTVVQLAQNWAEEQKRRIAAENKLKILTPKAQLMDRVLDTDEKIDIGQAAKILELPFGRNTMFKQLRQNGIFFKNRNEPRQEYIKRKYFVLKEKYIARNNHDGFVVVKVLVTQKGLEFLSNLFGGSNSQKEMALIR